MIYFTKDFLKFLADLEVNNNRDWFAANKEIFKNDVEAPFIKFIEDVINAIKKTDPSINLTAKEAVFRIYKDVRFSKDKTPYKTHMSAIVSAGGRKNFNIPGFYFEITADSLNIYSGLYKIDPKILLNIRTGIRDNLKEFQKLVAGKKFVERFGIIKGEKNKRITPEFLDAAEKEPLIFNKSFHYSCTFHSKLILKEGLIDEIMKVVQDAQPMNAYLRRIAER
ncbi:MAG: DUF2461 domain-containing protein [Bacteroidota bacterium]|nr:DUF2461 domain-containing protein [Bacteroidota bacterium]